jgi:hypothetical protein
MRAGPVRKLTVDAIESAKRTWIAPQLKTLIGENEAGMKTESVRINARYRSAV